MFDYEAEVGDKYMCQGPHNLVKLGIGFVKNDPEYRTRERLETLRALYNQEENLRLIQLCYLHGENKEGITKSCLHFVSERKVFPKGILYWDLSNISSCEQLSTVMLKDLGKKLGRDFEKEATKHLQSADSQHQGFVELLKNFFNNALPLESNK